MKDKLVIVTGASRGIGKAFLKKYRTQENTATIGINRTGSAGVMLDLFEKNATNDFVKKLDVSKFSRIIYMHAVGIDKFEPRCLPHIDYDGDGIDDEVLSSNYTAFVNLTEPLIEKVKITGIPMTICNIGSISDIFEVPYWQSFTKTKNKVRKYCKSIPQDKIRSIMLNVSSTLDDDGRTYGRKNIDTTYWQTVDKLVEKSFDTLDTFHGGPVRYAEYDFYSQNPLFRSDVFV